MFIAKYAYTCLCRYQQVLIPTIHISTEPDGEYFPPIPPPLARFPACGQVTDFQNGFSGYTQDKIDTFDWRRQRGRTPSSSTGPTADHTYGNSSGKILSNLGCFVTRLAVVATADELYLCLENGRKMGQGNCVHILNIVTPRCVLISWHELLHLSAGYYIYTETSAPRRPGDYATIRSPVYQVPRSPACGFSFWYHMYGASIANLTVELATSQGVATIYNIRGNKGNKWVQAQVPLPTIAFDTWFQVSSSKKKSSSIGIYRSSVSFS